MDADAHGCAVRTTVEESVEEEHLRRTPRGTAIARSVFEGSSIRKVTATDDHDQRWELGYRPALDGLRGLAALLVVVAHFDTPVLLGGGAVGVLTFFVLSGFLITALLMGERQQTGRIDVVALYRRRALRLLPALAVVLILTMLAAAINGTFNLVVLQAVAAAVYVANFFPVVEPLGHTWTLSVEEQRSSSRSSGSPSCGQAGSTD